MLLKLSIKFLIYVFEQCSKVKLTMYAQQIKLYAIDTVSFKL